MTEPLFSNGWWKRSYSPDALKCESSTGIKTTSHKLHQQHNETSNKKEAWSLWLQPEKETQPWKLFPVPAFSAVESGPLSLQLQIAAGAKTPHLNGITVVCASAEWGFQNRHKCPQDGIKKLQPSALSTL